MPRRCKRLSPELWKLRGAHLLPRVFLDRKCGSVGAMHGLCSKRGDLCAHWERKLTRVPGETEGTCGFMGIIGNKKKVLWVTLHC